jgi:hypothetical protein
MKRFWLVALSLGLIVAFSAQAMAVDVKFSGEFYAAGLYLDQTTLVKDLNTLPLKTYWYPSGSTGTMVPYKEDVSTAFYFQRLRLKTDFVVSPGLTLTTRFDAMERAWGAARTAPGTTLDSFSSGTTAENENIAFDLAYIAYISPIGIFRAGYQIDGVWGTVFGDNPEPTGKICYAIAKNGFFGLLQAGKVNDGENSLTAKNPSVTTTDRDFNFYTWAIGYKWKSGEVGLLNKTLISKAERTDTGAVVDPALAAFPFPSYTRVYGFVPYAKVKFGPVFIQSELMYAFGTKYFEADSLALRTMLGLEDKIKIRNLAVWVDANADFGMFYAGGTVAYVSGDDPGTRNKAEGGLATGGRDWNPCLIMFNNDLTYWAGAVTGYYSFPVGALGQNKASSISGPMTNAWFFQLRGGIRPIDKLDIGLFVSYANADKKPTADWQHSDYGTEVDLTATYKITNNLSYMLGAGYFFTGKFFKADYASAIGIDPSLNDNYLVINKLTLTF